MRTMMTCSKDQSVSGICYGYADITEVSVLLPRPSWQLSTMGEFEALLRITTSISSVRSVKSGGFSAVIGMRT